MHQRTFGECTDIIIDKLGNFLEFCRDYEDGKCGAVYNESGVNFRNIIEQLVGFYNEQLNPFATADLICLAENIEPEYYIDNPASEFTGRIDREFLPHASGYYTANAMIQFNSLIPELKKGGINAVDVDKILRLQQAIEYANSTHICISLHSQLAGCPSPDTIKQQASSGGKARADKLYGRTKEFAAKRFSEIRSRNSTMSLSQIAVKISAELEENPIPGDEPLTNAYDTIYRWIRILNKTKNYQS